MMRPRGFTLIELLVIIAVIAILTAAALASLSAAKNNGKDGAVKGDLLTIQEQAVQYYGIGDTYVPGAPQTACGTMTFIGNDANTTIDDQIKTAYTALQKVAKGGTIVCRAESSAFAIAGQLNNPIGGKAYWCVDSVGNALATSSPTASEFVCQ